MAFYLSKERDADVVGAYRRYLQYLRDHRHEFPPNAYALGTAEWYHNPSDRRCPHDGWLENVIISGIATKGHHRGRFTSIRIRLLGAYHDGYIEFFYPHVFGCEIQTNTPNLGDWRYDEFR